MALSRRSLIGAIICAPAVVRASSLMPVKVLRSAPEDLMLAQYEVVSYSEPYTVETLIARRMSDCVRELSENFAKNNALFEKLEIQSGITAKYFREGDLTWS